MPFTLSIDKIFDLYSREVLDLCALLLGDNGAATVIMVEAFSEMKEDWTVFDSEENAKSYWMQSCKHKCLRYINRVKNGGSVE